MLLPWHRRPFSLCRAGVRLYPRSMRKHAVRFGIVLLALVAGLVFYLTRPDRAQLSENAVAGRVPQLSRVRKQTILYWFRSKDALVAGVVEAAVEELGDAIEAALASRRPGTDPGVAVVDEVLRLGARRPDLLVLLREVTRLGPGGTAVLAEAIGPRLDAAAAALAATDDGGRSVECATATCERTGYGPWYCLETLAAAHAEAGDFGEARKWAREALRHAAAEEKIGCQEQLRLYRDGKPSREEPRLIHKPANLPADERPPGTARGRPASRGRD